MVSAKALLLISGIIFISTQLNSQSLNLIRTMQVKDCIYIALDHHHNLYTVRAKGEIRKWDNEGKPKEYNNSISLGRLGELDVEDPLKLLAFYPDYNTVLILDNRISEQRRLDLTSAGLFQLPGICHSFDDHIWVYDPNNLKLKKLNMNLKVTANSPDLSLILGYSPEISKIREHANKLYLLEREKGILIFDTYAQFDKQVSLKNIKDVIVNTDYLFYYKEGLFIYHLKSLMEVCLYDSPIANFIQLSVKGDRLAVLRKNHLDLYEIQF
jgi:hypothetical protein